MQQNIRLADMTVKDIRHLLVEDPAITQPDAPLKAVLQEMEKDLRTRHVYVVDDTGHLLGTVRMSLIIEYLFPFNAVVEKRHSLYETYVPKLGAKTAADLMHTPAVKVYEETTLGEMSRLMIREAINELPVVDKENRLIGQVNMYEVIRTYLSIAAGA